MATQYGTYQVPELKLHDTKRLKCEHQPHLTIDFVCGQGEGDKTVVLTKNVECTETVLSHTVDDLLDDKEV